MATDSSEIQNPSTPPQNPIVSQNVEPQQQPLPSPPPPCRPNQPLEGTPQSPETLEIENPQDSNPKPVDLDEEDQGHDDLEVLSPVSQPTSDRHVSSPFGFTYTRRGLKGKPSKKRAMMEKKSLKKLEVLKQTLKPIPFSPFKKNLDLSRHESLLKRLGLWDFLHAEFETNIHTDLIAQLIATYSPTNRCSYVNGVRINVSRADLARALNLPLKKDKGNVNVNVPDGSAEAKELEESVAFVRENVSNWMLLCDEMWILPEEVKKMVSLINEGSFEKVDWPSLIWLVMEKELTAPALGDCYYASHMQCLIKRQKKDLLLSEEVKEDVEADGEGNVKMLDRFDDVKATEPEEYKIELSLGHDTALDLKSNVENNLNESASREDNKFVEECNVDGNKSEQILFFDEKISCFEGREKDEEEENGQWFCDEKNNLGENQHLLRRCIVERVQGMVCEEGEENKGMDCDNEENKQDVGEGAEEGGEQEDEEMDERQQEEGGFSPSAIGGTLEIVTSANLIQGMEAEQVPTFTSEVQICDDDLPGEFLSSKVRTPIIPGGSSSHFSNGHKRDIHHDNELSHHSLNGGNKRMRNVGSWENKSSSEFRMCMEQMGHCMAKARMLYESKEQACEESNVNQQLFLNEVQRRDSIIEHLHKAKYDAEQKRQEEVYRLERELFLMGGVLEEYRKALKETRKEFAEYIAGCPQPDAPLYKDVPGGEGLVLSVMELEKQRLKQEEEERMNRLLIEKKLKDIEDGWTATFGAHEDRVQQMCNRLFDLENEVKPLKEKLRAKGKVE